MRGALRQLLICGGVAWLLLPARVAAQEHGAGHAAPAAVVPAGAAQRQLAVLLQRAVELVPSSGEDDEAPSASARRELEALREAIASLPRATLADGEWLDAHLVMQACDRRLAAPLPASAGGDGEPIGTARFEWLLRHDHQLHLTAADLGLLGEQIYAQTLDLLAAQARTMDAGATWQELSLRARQDRVASAGELLPLCRRLAWEAWRFAEDSGLVSIPDAAIDLGTRLAKKRADKPYAWYQPGRLEDGFYNGAYMVTPVPDDLDPVALDQLLGDANEHWMRVVSLHEAIPGHHLQFSCASLIDSPVRGWGYTSVLVEGWGLYVEEAMHRHGYYTNPLTRLVQLRMRLWRAARVLIDVGLHCGNMSRADAERLLVDGVLLAPDNAAREVDRYLHNPTQPMSYIVGMLQIESLRRAAMRQAGAANWSERDFHDRFLSCGPIPIDLIRAVMLGPRERARYDRAHP